MWFLKVNGEYFAMYKTKKEAVAALWYYRSIEMTEEKTEICKAQIVEVEE